MIAAFAVAILLAAADGSDSVRSAADSLKEGREAYLEDAKQELAAIDFRLDTLYLDRMARYGPDSVYQRGILGRARTVRDHVDNIMDDLSAVAGEMPPEPWEELRSRLRIGLDSLARLYFAADSSRRAEAEKAGNERRARGP